MSDGQQTPGNSTSNFRNSFPIAQDYIGWLSTNVIWIDRCVPDIFCETIFFVAGYATFNFYSWNDKNQYFSFQSPSQKNEFLQYRVYQSGVSSFERKNIFLKISETRLSIHTTLLESHPMLSGMVWKRFRKFQVKSWKRSYIFCPPLICLYALAWVFSTHSLSYERI